MPLLPNKGGLKLGMPVIAQGLPKRVKWAVSWRFHGVILSPVHCTESRQTASQMKSMFFTVAEESLADALASPFGEQNRLSQITDVCRVMSCILKSGPKLGIPLTHADASRGPNGLLTFIRQHD